MRLGQFARLIKSTRKLLQQFCVSRDDKGVFHILTPCGVCQERLMYWGNEVEAVQIPVTQFPKLQICNWKKASSILQRAFPEKLFPRPSHTIDTRYVVHVVIGKFILQDLKAASARIDSELMHDVRKPFAVIIDEFADLAQEDFIGFLDRARSSKMAIVVAHQEICDLQGISPEFAGRLMGNTSTLYAFLQKRPESAEMIAGIAGTRKGWEETIQSEKLCLFDIPSGKKSLREVEEFQVHPNIIKSLPVGKCVSVKKYPKAKAYRVDVFPEKAGKNG